MWSRIEPVQLPLRIRCFPRGHLKRNDDVSVAKIFHLQRADFTEDDCASGTIRSGEIETCLVRSRHDPVERRIVEGQLFLHTVVVAEKLIVRNGGTISTARFQCRKCSVRLARDSGPRLRLAAL